MFTRVTRMGVTKSLGELIKVKDIAFEFYKSRVLIFCRICTKQTSGAVQCVKSDHLQLLDQSFPTSRLPRPCWERCLGVLKRAFHRKLPPLLAGVAVSGEIGPFSGSFRHSKRLNTHAHPLQYSTRPQNDIQG